MNSHEREDWLRRVIVGEIEHDDERIVELARRDPEFARELQASLDVIDALERDGVLGEAQRAPAPRTAPPRWRPSTLLPLAAAVIAALVSVTWWWSRSPGQPRSPDDTLLGPELRGLVPTEARPGDFTHFEWTAPKEFSSARLHVSDESGRELEPIAVAGTSCEIEPERAGEWPERIVWWIEFLDADEREIAKTGPTRAVRTPR